MIPIAKELDADYILAYFGDYFEKIGTNADSREKDNTHDIDLNGFGVLHLTPEPRSLNATIGHC